MERLAVIQCRRRHRENEPSGGDARGDDFDRLCDGLELTVLKTIFHVENHRLNTRTNLHHRRCVPKLRYGVALLVRELVFLVQIWITVDPAVLLPLGLRVHHVRRRE